MNKFDDCSDRLLLFLETLDEKELQPETVKYDHNKSDPVVEVQTQEEANLITSKCKDGLHAPVLDFDYPIEVYPSSQLGHYHLYLGKKIPWASYKAVLTCLGYNGLVENGFAKASITKGYSSVRPIGVVKTNAPKGSDILIENARLRQVNYQLIQERIQLLSLLEEHLQLTTT